MRKWMLISCLFLPLLVGCDWKLFVVTQRPVISPELAQEFDIVGEWHPLPFKNSPLSCPESLIIRPAHDDGAYGVTSNSPLGANVRLKMTALPNTDSIALVEFETTIAGEFIRTLALAKVDGDDLYFSYLDGAKLVKVLREEQIITEVQRRGICTAIDCDSSKLVSAISAHWRDLVTDSCTLHRTKM